MSQPPPADRVLNLLLTHQNPAQVRAMLKWWQQRIGAAPDNLLVAYGGTRENFDALEHLHKVFVDDARLRTVDHMRERQSYRGVFQAAAAWLDGHAGLRHTHVYFSEFDHLPLAADLNRRQLEALASEGADVLGLRVARIDGSSHPHYLYHASDPAFHRCWREISRRNDPQTILTMLGTGSFWTRETFAATAAAPEPLSVYLELFLPTMAHHLGYRVRPYPDPAARAFITHLGDSTSLLSKAEADGAWTIHPVKTLWNEVSR